MNMAIIQRHHFFDIREVIPPETREEAIKYFYNLFGNNHPIVVEIGSGNGHFLVDYAMKNPQKNIIGTEILKGRAQKFYKKVQKRGLNNVLIFKGDSRQFVWEFLYQEMVEEFIILFPDPWPKKRHHKHRLLQASFIKMLHYRLVPGGEVSIATDFTPYREWIISEFEKEGGFKNLTGSGVNYPEHYPDSLFHQRLRKKGKNIYFMKFKKIPEIIPF